VVAYCQNHEGYLEKLSKNRETLVGEAAYAVEYEMACTLDDVLFARTGLGTIGHPGEEVVETVCSIMSSLLRWDEKRSEQEKADIERRYHWADA
jgi:glycerol-3-phosphate dehydrogenase